MIHNVTHKALEAKTDTIIKIVHDTLRNAPKDIQPLDVINKVDIFYNNAWTKLTSTVTIFFILVGIIVPLIIQWYQKRELKLSEDRLKKDIHREVESSLEKLRNEIEVKLEQSLKQFKDDSDNLLKNVRTEIENEQLISIDKLKKENAIVVSKSEKALSKEIIAQRLFSQGLIFVALGNQEVSAVNFLQSVTQYSLLRQKKTCNTAIKNAILALRKSKKIKLLKAFDEYGTSFEKEIFIIRKSISSNEGDFEKKIEELEKNYDMIISNTTDEIN